MKINSITNNHNTSFASFECEKNRKPVYKKYYELNDTELAARSINKAMRTAQKSGKMQLLKALPFIATSVAATSLAISQPGKLSSKVNTGLGFLALASGIDLLTEKFNNISKNKKTSSDEKRKTALKALAATCIATMGAVKLTKNNKVGKFIKNEISQFAKEIDSTKLAKFTEKKINPFLKNHKVLDFALGFVLPFVTVYKTNALSNKLANSIDKDFQKNVALNFAKGKEIQKIARAHFDSIEAKEI